MIEPKLIQGDCMEYLSTVEDNSIDVIITDVPYGIGFQSARRTEAERFAKIENDEFPYIEWIEPAFKKLKEGGRLLMFYRYDVQDIFFNELKRVGFDIKSQIVWDKVIHGLGDLSGQFAPQHELIVYATKGRYEFRGGRPKTIIRECRVPTETQIHPNEKPVNLMRKLILSVTEQGETIFEPFMGSGSTVIACIKEKRNVVAIELSKKYYESAILRINNYKSQYKLF